MSQVVEFPRRVKRRKPSLKEALVFEIARTLQMLGGVAHRDVVVGDIARRAGFDERHPPFELREDLFAAFDGALADGGLGLDLLFVLPFGPGSHRWSLAPGVMSVNLQDPRFSHAG